MLEVTAQANEKLIEYMQTNNISSALRVALMQVVVPDSVSAAPILCQGLAVAAVPVPADREAVAADLIFFPEQ
jgi:predicted DNA-binding ribbon-helix-helix protein